MALTRDVSITYNGLLLGGSSTAYRLTGPFTFNIGRDLIVLSTDVIVQGTTEAAFLSAEAALCTAFRGAKGTLTVMLGASTRYTFSHASNTGMNAEGEATKGGSILDSGLAALYHVTVKMERPWDFSGEGGLRSLTISCTRGSNNLRVLTLGGQFSATSGNSATDNYYNASTGANALGTQWLSTFGLVNSDLTTALVQPDKDNKHADFTRTYAELGFAKTTTHATTFKEPVLDVQFEQQEFGSSNLTARRPVGVQATYTATVLFPSDGSNGELTNINLSSPQDLAQFIKDNLDPKVFTYVRSVSGDFTGPMCVVSRSPRYNPFTNAIAVAYQLLVYPSALIEQNVSVQEQADQGEMLTAVWDGSEFAKDAQPVPRNWDRMVTIVQSLLNTTGVGSSTDLIAGSGAVADPGLEIIRQVDPIDLVGNERFRLVSRSRDRRRSYIGTVLASTASGTQVVQVTFETWTFLYTRFDVPKDGLSIGTTGSTPTGGAGTGPGAPSSVGDQLINRTNRGG